MLMMERSFNWLYTSEGKSPSFRSTSRTRAGRPSSALVAAYPSSTSSTDLPKRRGAMHDQGVAGLVTAGVRLPRLEYRTLVVRARRWRAGCLPSFVCELSGSIAL